MATHRVRLAKQLKAASGIPYQQALQVVIRESDAGWLPARLDDAGMSQALTHLLFSVKGPGLGDHPARYVRLEEITGGRLARHVAERLAKARTRTPAPASDWPGTSNAEHIGQLYDEDDEPRPAWLDEVIAAGERVGYEIPCSYPGRGELPLDQALDERDIAGDVWAYEQQLRRIAKEHPQDVDAWAHLGHHMWAVANGGDDTFRLTSPPSPAARRQGLHAALGYYETAVAVAELSLPERFTGFLAWGCLYNRPLHRALHGLVLTWWQLGRLREAEMTVRNMLWLNPNDNLGVRDFLPDLHARTAWADAENT